MADSTATHLATADLSTAEIRQALLDLLCQFAYQTGDFTLSSGQKSSYYINCKPVTLHPQGAVALGRLMLTQLPPDTHAVAGLTLGADPMVSAISVVSAYTQQPIPGLIVRKKPKGHGTQAYIEVPTLAPNSNIVVVEDVVTTGASALKAVERLQGAGYQVTKLLALVDRQQGGAETYAGINLPFEALFTIPELHARWEVLQA